MALQPWRAGNVIKILDENSNTRRYWVQVPELGSFDFTPGQFVTLDLPIHEKPNKRWRSYSIASWPDGSNVFELIIVLTPHGVGSTWIFENVKEGIELKFRGPQGTFILPNEWKDDLFLICTGTGIAPYRSMLHALKTRPVAERNIYLIFGTRTQADILYYEEMKELSSEIKGLQYIPTLSRENWDGRQGYVHPIYEELCAARQPAQFYLCGWRNMIDEARQRITAMGYDKKSIHVELYG
jgi:CDP-4-dehydro-6-deoxyglucose reductase